METYETLRQFAGGWGLIGMVIFFVGAIAYAFRPGSRKKADDAAEIPFKED